MKQAILQEVISIRNRLGTIIKDADPQLGKDWVMFERIVAAHKNLRGIEIDKSTPMGDENQPHLPEMPEHKNNICPTCEYFKTCEFEIKKQGGVSDCENYHLKRDSTGGGDQEGGSSEQEEESGDGEELSPEEKEKLSKIIEDNPEDKGRKRKKKKD